MDGWIGEMMMFGASWAPRNWALCQGQLLAITQFQALFSIIGTIYGGDGRTTFGLPDMRGRVAMGEGSGPGLSPRRIGAKFGTETNTLNTLQMPSHNHSVALNGETAQADSKNPNNRLLAVVNGESQVYAGAVPDTERVMHPDSISQQNVGGNQAVNNIQPTQVVSYIICLNGTYPSRS